MKQLIIDNRQPLFQVTTFKNALSTQWLGRSLLYFEELQSTNTYLKQLPREEINHGLICITDNQTKGRGQYEKNWESQPGKNLTFTIALTPNQNNRFHVITLAFARCIVEELEELTGLESFIKWPNDIYVNGKKVGGLLTESVFSGNKIDRVLVGIGLNINQQYFSEELQHMAASLFLLTDKEFEREILLAHLLSRMEYAYGRWQKIDTSLLKEVNQKIIGYGKWVKLQVNGEIWEESLKVIGINEMGQLLVINEEGEIEKFSYEQIRILAD